MLTCFKPKFLPDSYNLLSNDNWCSKLEYLVDILLHFNKAYTSMQGPNQNILICSDKFCALLDKIQN